MAYSCGIKRIKHADTGIITSNNCLLPKKKVLTFQLDANEVGVAEVFQEDAVRRRGLEVEADIGAGLGLKCGEMQIRRWRDERRGIPEVS